MVGERYGQFLPLSAEPLLPLSAESLLTYRQQTQIDPILLVQDPPIIYRRHTRAQNDRITRAEAYLNNDRIRTQSQYIQNGGRREAMQSEIGMGEGVAVRQPLSVSQLNQSLHRETRVLEGQAVLQNQQIQQIRQHFDNREQPPPPATMPLLQRMPPPMIEPPPPPPQPTHAALPLTMASSVSERGGYETGPRVVPSTPQGLPQMWYLPQPDIPAAPPSAQPPISSQGFVMASQPVDNRWQWVESYRGGG